MSFYSKIRNNPIRMLVFLVLFLTTVFAQNLDYSKRALALSISPETIYINDMVTVKAETLSGDAISSMSILVISTKSGSQSDLDQYNGETNSKGEFTFQPRLGGEYEVQAHDSEYRTTTIRTTITNRLRPQLLISTTSLCPGDQIEATVTSDGNPITQATITLDNGTTEKTDASGKTIFSISPGSHTIIASMGTYVDGNLTIEQMACKKPVEPPPQTSNEPLVNESEKMNADEELRSANTQIEIAQQSNKDTTQAERKLVEAQTAYASADYITAEAKAKEAEQLAQEAKPKVVVKKPESLPPQTVPEEPAPPQNQTLLIVLAVIGVVGIVIVAGALYFILSHMKKEKRGMRK